MNEYKRRVYLLHTACMRSTSLVRCVGRLEPFFDGGMLFIWREGRVECGVWSIITPAGVMRCMRRETEQSLE